jgi:predicted enzyme related to lactoylglutathione lyase
MAIKMKLMLASSLLLISALLPLQLISAAPVLPPLNSTNTGEQLAGKFIWFDLATVDIATQKKFYGDVFGWTYQPVSQSDKQYTIIKNGERNIAGMFQIKPRADAKAGALWISLMSVTDPNNAVATAKKAGGSIRMPVTSMAQRGTFAVLKDPEGAVFGVLKSDSGDPPDRDIQTGEFLWVDLFARDIQRAATFYQKLAGYEIVDDEPNVQRKFLRSADKYRAGIVPLPDEANRSGWLPYIKVTDVAATLQKVTDAGGHIMVEPDDSLFNGNLAIFADPEGGIVGIVKWEQP